MDIPPIDLGAPDRPVLNVFWEGGMLGAAHSRAWDRGPMVVRTRAGDWVQATVRRVWLVPRADGGEDEVLELEHEIRTSTASCLYYAPGDDENLRPIDPKWDPLRDGWRNKIPPRPAY